MYDALFPLLVAAGVAMAWRSNPMYSLGKTVRFLALCGLAVAVYVGALIGVVDATTGMSEIDAGAALGVTILVGTMFFIWVIVTASTPRPAAIPRGSKLVFVHRAKVLPWLKRLPVPLVVFASFAFALDGEARDLVLVFGGMICFLSIVMVFTLYVAALGMDRSLTSVEAAPWVHWTYSLGRWSAWRDALVSRAAAQQRSWIWSRDWMKLVVPFLIVAVALLALNFASVPLGWSASFFASIGVLMVVMIELVARFEARAPERLRRLLLKAPPETYAGAAGIFCDGVYVEWMTPSNYLISATIDERSPRCINLEFERIVVGAASPQPFTQSVLLPPNAGDDLRTLQAHLAVRCPSARVELAIPGNLEIDAEPQSRARTA
jgi:hypothetical protein